MRDAFFIFQVLTFACLTVLGSGAIVPSEPKLTTKLTPVNSPSYEDSVKDLTAAASDRTFHISKDYGQPGGYGGGVPYGSYLGSSIYPGTTAYRGTGLSPGYLNPSYKGYVVGGPGGIIGGGNIGYGYYGSSGYNPNYGGYGGYGYGANGGYGGYGGYSGYGTGLSTSGGYVNGYGSAYGSGYGSGIYEDAYYGNGGRGGYGRYGGLDGYGYGGGYNGYGGSNYGTSYAAKSNYDPYAYRSNSYGSYTGYPSGYRGYS
ncbi:PREDICTED: glycine-rich cell wall structural protein 2-like [Habropoda laboriosa]|uniref:glycine-rich cell wall structural protein 2-like n=1 Tax=Habropoda laboriosa TaxID=597456 RepID=UPI00083DD5E7|nr:PREDICTED: glycine-rich cell wall structural protein 2-like [Habropoda laboriosa]